MKLLPQLFWAVFICINLSACGGGGSNTPSNPNPPSPSTVSSSSALNSLSSNASTTSSSTSSIISALSCTIDGKKYSLCSIDNGEWGFENNTYCVAQSFCPTARTQLPSLDMPTRLVNPQADVITQKVFTYLQSIWGQKILSGQMDLTWDDSISMIDRVHRDTGKYPAIMGYDFMNYGMTATWVKGISQTEEAIEYWNSGGLVTFAWHWRDPAKLKTAQVNSAEFYTTDQATTDFRIPVKNGALDTSSTAYIHLNDGIDLIASELKALQDAGVPVLWRPLHEASGGWFWWGASRADDAPRAFAQILLWRHMYDRLTNHHQLNNLIWVWNGQSSAWYPGDGYVDIVSQDIYADNFNSQSAKYNETRNYAFEKKMVALSETGKIPDPDKMVQDQAMWLWFMVWNDGDKNEPSDFWSGTVNPLSHRQHVYSHENVITRRDLPPFKN
jgi:mannan endo-1,4-beta-mannosidase